MKTIEAEALVTPEGFLTVQAPGVQPGSHRVVIVIDDYRRKKQSRKSLHFSSHPVTFVSDQYRCRREEIYDDEGR